MALDVTRIRRYIQGFELKPLFIDELAWDKCNIRLSVPIDGHSYDLVAIAEKRGMVAFNCTGDGGKIPDYNIRRKIEKEVAKSVHEHLLVFTDAAQTTQIWQWVKREPGKPAMCRESAYHKGQHGEALIQKLQSLAFTLEDELVLTIVDVAGRARAAFDLEKVTKKFYERFKTEHAAFLKFLKDIPDEEMQRWYASVMLNRLMFIYFIQKKGFLNNDVNYLRTKLAESQSIGKDRYYSEFLCPLFFLGFAQQEQDRSAETNKLLGKVPYLNGGLFLRHHIEELHGDKISLPDSVFERLFSFFEQYQWHLDERPLRADNEINPDVLGYIFEKYINQKQMGAYYTKEDITEYISKNTIIPYLFDAAKQKCRIAFEGIGSVWRLLQADPDRYIYDAVEKGVDLPLPADIVAGLDDVSKRTGWNKPAPAEFALPTEIWREVVARRRRYEEVRTKLASGDVQSINDLITYNLDIRQFAQDVIENCEGPELLRAFWKGIKEVTVLDPTCGSGAFLFAALNILEPLYEACLQRMESFVDDLERLGEKHRPEKFSDFRAVLKEVASHPNERYFILKSIILNNLFGVDIMDEAVEICKLRLFLKMVAQLESDEHIEPLPDIDFNIRAGNTLVGYATYEQVKEAVNRDATGQGKMVFDDAMERIEAKAQDVDRLFALFRRQQTEIGGEVTATDKERLRAKLRELETELNTHLAEDYQMGLSTKPAAYAKWLKSHKPFHWFVEFHSIMGAGGFDAIIGNPPYLELKELKDYRLIGYSCLDSGNLYAPVLERCYQICSSLGRQGFIVPVSSISTDRYASLQRILSSNDLHYSSFDDRPCRLFDGLEHSRLTIHLIGARSQTPSLTSTRYNKWSRNEREVLFRKLVYAKPCLGLVQNTFPKFCSDIERSIGDKLVRQRTPLSVHYSTTGSHRIFYSRKVGYFLQVLDFQPRVVDGESRLRPPSEFKALSFASADAATAALCCLNSNLFYWFITVFSDCRHVNKREVDAFPVDLASLSSGDMAKLQELSRKLMSDLIANSEDKPMRFAHDNLVVQCIFPKRSKAIIDAIDATLAKHYDFTDEELEFIINYDIKYRMGLTVNGEDAEDGEE